MANSDWAPRAPKTVGRWATLYEREPVGDQVDRRIGGDRRIVSHVDNGFVWGPAPQLLRLVGVADYLSNHGQVGAAQIIREVLGIDV